MGVTWTNAEITERRKAEMPDATNVQVWRDYAEGRHGNILTTDQTRLLGPRTQHAMVDNILDLILKTTAARLRLTEWKVMGETPASITDGTPVGQGAVDAVTGWLASLWLMNRLPRLQYEVHYAELRDGQSAISMGYRNGRVHLWRESWWDGDTGLFVAYDDAGEYEFAVKEWDQRERDGTTIRRRTVYEPGLITRWQRAGDGWQEYQTREEPAAIVMQKRDGTPLPIPVVHFPNGSGVADSVYGVSEVANLLALQDDLNATQLDISAAAMLTAFQRLFGSGISDPKKVSMPPGAFVGVPEENARLTVVPPGEVSPLMAVHHFKRESMSVTSRTPVHTLTGDWPSGAALLRAEMPLIEKIEGMADVNGPQWTMVAHRAMELFNAYGTGTELDETVPITSVFAPAERIDELTELEIQRARAEAWDILSRLPKAAMIEAGVPADVAEALIEEREMDAVRVQRFLDAGGLDPMPEGDV